MGDYIIENWNRTKYKFDVMKGKINMEENWIISLSEEEVVKIMNKFTGLDESIEEIGDYYSDDDLKRAILNIIL